MSSFLNANEEIIMNNKKTFGKIIFVFGKKFNPKIEKWLRYINKDPLTLYKQLKRILVGADVNRNITQFDNLKKHLDPIGKGLFDFEKGSLAEFFHSVQNYVEEKKVDKHMPLLHL